MTAIIILMVWVIYVRNMNKHIVLFDNKNTEVILVRKLLLHSRLWSKAIILLADMSHGLRKYVYGTLLCARVKLAYIETVCMCGDVLHRQRAHFAMTGWVFILRYFLRIQCLVYAILRNQGWKGCISIDIALTLSHGVESTYVHR